MNWSEKASWHSTESGKGFVSDEILLANLASFGEPPNMIFYGN